MPTEEKTILQREGGGDVISTALHIKQIFFFCCLYFK